MLEKTYLTGKADYLEASLERMTRHLAAHDFHLDFSAWLNPAPFIHSVHVKDSDCPALFANGKGISAKAAQASAMGEFIERLGSHYLFADYYLGQATAGFLMHPQEKRIDVAQFQRSDVLSNDLWAIYDVNHAIMPAHLIALQDASNLITAMPLQNARSQENTYFPINLLNSLYASNGLAAGNTLAEAGVQGLSEVFERWVRVQILQNGWCLPVMSTAVWAAMPSITQAANALRVQGIRLDIRDASLGGRYPVVAIILHDELDGRTFVSFGAHPIFEVAIERTLTESLQGRDLNSRDGFEYPSIDQAFVASDENREAHFIDASGRWHLGFFGQQADFEAFAWSFSGDIEAQWQQLQQLVIDAGFSLYWQHHQQLGLAVVRLVVPGMSEIYPMQDLFDGNANRGLPLKQALNAIDWNKDRSFESLLALIEQEAYPAHTRVASLIGLLPDVGTPWAWLTIAELKLGTLLYLGDFNAALQALGEVFAIGRATPEYYALEMALPLLESETLAEKGDALPVLFGEERWAQLVQWLDGETFIWDIELIAPERYSARHQALLRAHQRINNALVQA